VDELIFTPEWRYKGMMEALIKVDPRITIIPKSSTKSAMAFINSSLRKERNKDELRIVTTLSRES
jgi:hypothetical protein